MGTNHFVSEGESVSERVRGKCAKNVIERKLKQAAANVTNMKRRTGS